MGSWYLVIKLTVTAVSTLVQGPYDSEAECIRRAMYLAEYVHADIGSYTYSCRENFNI